MNLGKIFRSAVCATISLAISSIFCFSVGIMYVALNFGASLMLLVELLSFFR